jgi:cysteine desulfurase
MNRYYFDHNATTPVSPEVREALIECLGEVYGNASSIHHFGQAAKQRLETGRRQIAALLNCEPREIVFTSGGTEADNLAVFGAVRASCHERKHVITTAIEHPAVLGPCRQLEREGVDVTYLPVSPDGVVSPDDVRRAIRPGTALISVMHANNELGTIQPIGEIARIARESGVLMHADGVQSTGKIPIDVRALGVDLYSISGHKFYAPKGAGALYVRQGVKLTPLQYGGRHERERRAGTENVPGAAALGAAAAWVSENLESEGARLTLLRDRLERGIIERIPKVTVNGNAGRTPNTANLCFEGIEAEALLIALDLRGFAVSTGSACSSGAVEPSHVLLALGLAPERARASIRFSLGRTNTESQVDELIDAVADCVSHLRRLSPTYAA